MEKGFITMKGSDANGQAIVRKMIQSKLVSIGQNKLTNTNGTEFRIGSIQYVTGHGEIVTRSSQIWEKNVDRLTAGQEYLTEVRVANGVVYLNTSSLTSAARATADDFAGFEEVAAPKAAATAPASADILS